MDGREFRMRSSQIQSKRKSAKAPLLRLAKSEASHSQPRADGIQKPSHIPKITSPTGSPTQEGGGDTGLCNVCDDGEEKSLRITLLFPKMMGSNDTSKAPARSGVIDSLTGRMGMREGDGWVMSAYGRGYGGRFEGRPTTRRANDERPRWATAGIHDDGARRL
ncbi:hypothetical protein BDQ12DRAFT_663460 [Crucibulum laeve]|uniref:Uncharacterized protein n=1 Tax=Crucibulum laeve TaxID=68775 RepID=A0A5C3M9T5_9AGAR|nr:hypothetical protein BDQ12DRAFT_663460 [Crucibulum laeve]